ncbi:MAG TPA: response regulator, partial [Terriglobales bacterium]
MRDHVAAEGWDVDWAVDLKTAIQAIEERSYSLALLDLGLPDGCGLKLLDIFNARSLATPSIIISASDHVADRQRIHALGAVSYLVKPFSLVELTLRIKAVLGTGCPGSATNVPSDRSVYQDDNWSPLRQDMIAPMPKRPLTTGWRWIRS